MRGASWLWVQLEKIGSTSIPKEICGKKKQIVKRLERGALILEAVEQNILGHMERLKACCDVNCSLWYYSCKSYGKARRAMGKSLG